MTDREDREDEEDESSLFWMGIGFVVFVLALVVVLVWIFTLDLLR